MYWRISLGECAALALVATAALLSPQASSADSRAITFEAPYVTGSINGQQGWGGQTPPGIAINPSIDQAVSNVRARGGSQSFRMSSFFTSGSFGDQVFSPSLTDRAGEPGSIAGGFAGGTLKPRFTASWYFLSAVVNAPQNTHVVVSPDRGDGARMSWIQMSDNVNDPTVCFGGDNWGGDCTSNADCTGGGSCVSDGRHGLSVSYYDYKQPADLNDCDGGPTQVDAENKCFVFHVVATNLPRNVWHRVDVEMEFYDGKANDVERVSVDGGAPTVGTTWEDYFPNNQDPPFTNEPPPVDSLLFRVGGAAEGNSGEGIFFDDVSYASTDCQAATRYVSTSGDDTLSDCRDVGSPCLTVQHAVDVACSGDTISVAAGTYTEQVSIGKSVHVVGAGSGSTHVKAPGSMAPATSVVTVSGGGVSAEISHLDVAGPGPSGCGSIRAGIDVRGGAHADIHDNAITNIRDNPFSGCQNGLGIVVGSSATSTSGSATITNNTITGYQKNAIVVTFPGSSATVTGNTTTGAGPQTLIAQNGIQVSNGATATVSGNAVTGNECNHASCGPDPINDTQSCGILLFGQAPGTQVTGNSVSANDIGVLTYSDSPSSVTGNTLTNNRYVGMFLGEGTTTATGNSLSGGNYGVFVASFTGDTSTAAGNLSCNRIQSAGVGIDVVDTDLGDGFGATLVANGNSITGNGTGLKNETAPVLNAESNWWGCVGGPNTPGCGTTVGNVDFTPFATSVPACVSCNSNADCSDGLACDGAETCNLGTHTCQAGSPPNCGSFSDQCNVGTCSEPSGTCHAVPKPNGTLCTASPDTCSIPDTCQSGGCSDGGGGDPDSDGICSADDNCPAAANASQHDLDGDGIGDVCDANDAALNVTKLKLQRGTGDHGAVIASGDLTLLAGDTLNAGGGIALKIVDSFVPTPTTITAAFGPNECIVTSGGARITCKSSDNRRRIDLRQLKTTPTVYRFSIKLKRLTGLGGPFLAPVAVTLTQTGNAIDRVGSISDCQSVGSGLVCREL